MKKQAITEEYGLQKQWYEQAVNMTLDKLPGFLNHLLNDYQHDYGTICHAIAAGAIATIHAMDRHPQGRITGFQASCIMWEIIRQLNYSNNKCGMRLIDYDEMLYPQCQDKFEKTISKETWDTIREEAKKLMKKNKEAYSKYQSDIKQYKIDIAKFKNKFPGYDSHPEFYEHLISGTGKEWDEYDAKQRAGFEFAPLKPHDPRPHPAVLEHWKSIVSGEVPFGYQIEKEG